MAYGTLGKPTQEDRQSQSEAEVCLEGKADSVCCKPKEMGGIGQEGQQEGRCSIKEQLSGTKTDCCSWHEGLGKRKSQREWRVRDIKQEGSGETMARSLAWEGSLEGRVRIPEASERKWQEICEGNSAGRDA